MALSSHFSQKFFVNLTDNKLADNIPRTLTKNNDSLTAHFCELLPTAILALAPALALAPDTQISRYTDKNL